MAATELSSNSPVCYFVRIAMHGQPKWRIKLPKLLIKTKHRKLHFFHKEGDNANHRDNKSTRAKRTNQLTRKVGSAFSYVLRSNKISLGKYFLSGEKNDQTRGKLDKIGYEELGKELACEDEPIVAALSEFLKFEQNLEDEDAQKRKHDNRQLSLSEKKKKVRSFICKAKMKTTSYSKSNAVKESGDSPTRFKIVGWRGSWRHLVHIRSKLKMAMSIKKVNRRFEENKDNNEGLCRKRILLGRRCKPLNFSGILNYGEDGPLLPGILP